MLTHEEQEKIIGGLLKLKENSLCADCNSKMPCWASLDFGVFVCMNCSGAHRALGPSITRVKSTRLDTWNKGWLENMQLGNSVLNVYWQHQLLQEEQSSKKPTASSPIEAIIRFVQDKYVRKLYANHKEPVDPLRKYKSGQSKPQQQPHKQQQPLKQQQPHKQQQAFEHNSQIRTNNTKIAPLGPAQSIKQHNKAKFADFSVFDKVVRAEQLKLQIDSNLISFEEEKGSLSSKNVGFDGFQFSSSNSKPKEEKYSKQQFMSMGGISSAKPKGQVDFQSFRKINGTTNANTKAQNLINFQTLVDNKNSRKANSLPYQLYDEAKGQSFGLSNLTNKHNYATVGAFLPVKPQINLQVYQQMHAKSYQAPQNQFRSSGYEVCGQYFRNPSQKVHQEGFKSISLQSNMNFDRMVEKNTKVQANKSWVDQWK